MSQSLQPPTQNLAILQRGKVAGSSMLLLRRLLTAYLRPYRWRLLAALFFMAITSLMRGIFTHFLQLITDGMDQRLGLHYMGYIAGSVIVIFFIRGVCDYLRTVIMNVVGQRVVANIQQDMYRHALYSDLSFFHANASGTLISRIISDVQVMRSTVSEVLLNSFRGGLDFVVLVGVMFYQDWRLSLIIFLIFPISAWIVARIGKRLRKISGNTQNATGDFTSFLSQTFQGIRHVRAYGNEELESARVSGVTELIYKLNVKSNRLSAVSGPMMEILSSFAAAFLIVYGYYQVEQGTNTPGDLVAFIGAFVLAYDPMKRMGRVNLQLQQGLAALDRIFLFLDTKPEIVDRVDARPLATSDYSVGIEDVTFNYADGTTALSEVTIRVPHGKTVAIVGPSGAGKSTIVNLLPRFHDVQKGQITVGGQDLRTVTLESLRSKIALVAQETALFDDTVRANIAYGKAGATDAEIRSAAEAAFADQFIDALPQGFETMVGEHGVKLSGGQRQRIAIARAMLRNAPLLLLDEATSALDNESERAVQAALKRLKEGRTTIVVAHRLSTIVDADRIVVLDQGRVVEEGTHTELLARRGVYARLYGLQTELS